MKLWPMLAFLSFCSVPAHAGSPLLAGYFGPDHRVHAYDQPLDNAVQRLNLAGGWCTAFLITPEFAISAGHCTRENPQNLSLDQSGSLTFGFAVDSSYTAPTYGVVTGSDGVSYTRDDWGLVHLGSRANLPNLELASPDELVVGASAMAIGYPGLIYGGQWRVEDTSCTVRELRADSILTDCATAKGQSGGPLLILTPSGRWKVAGVCSTELLKDDGSTVQGDPYSPALANRFTNITGASTLIFGAIKGYPATFSSAASAK